jgi:Cytochrome P460
MRTTIRISLIVAFVALPGVARPARAVAAPPAGVTGVEFTADGNLKLPVGYRKWIYVGASVTPNDRNDGHALFPEFHSVYIDPESFTFYEKTGKYRDGTVLIKELASVGGTEETSGKGYFMGDFSSLEVSIKDSKRFQDEPGTWAYFSFDYKHPDKKTAAKHATASCNQCHEENSAADFVFSQDYPVLRTVMPASK